MSIPGGTENAARSLSAFLVDAEADHRAFFQATLRICARASALRTAASVEEAMAQLRNARGIDVVFVDLHQPGQSARDLVAWLRAHPELAQVLVIAITRDLKAAAAPAREVGASAVLVKPISAVDLTAMLTLAEASRETRARRAPQ